MVNIIPRWRIKFKYPDGSIENVKLYGEDKQTMYDKWSKNFEVISVNQDTDTSYIDYINQIKNGSELIAQNSKKQIYKYHHNDSFILVKLYTDGDDYYDYCEYQRWDCRGLMNPISWTLSNPREFCEWFGKPITELPQGFVVTPKEIKKMKAKRFYNKEGEILWVDDLGYIYSAEKSAMPNKDNKAEWDKFHDNPNAVLVSYVLATPDNIHGDSKIGWFESKESFLRFFQTEKVKVPSYATSPRYEIRKAGYRKVKPEDRKVILRLPYINIDGELAYGISPEDIALSWSRMCDRKWQGRTLDCYSWLIDVVKHYKEWLNK